MKYSESQTDRRNRQWFLNDFNHVLLRSIDLKKGNIRSLAPFKIDFKYPITAIAGKNCSGKSTVLAIAACAFHNSSSGFHLPERKVSYYTFNDFFVQYKDEVPPQGIELFYEIAHNKWKKTARFPDGIGCGLQRRFKRQGGRWNDYSQRVNRDVAFLGIARIVPHSEKSQSKSYSKYFKKLDSDDDVDSIKDIVGYILNKKYESLSFTFASKYRLPFVKTDSNSYSGFNMGAGENALFEIFWVIFHAKPGVLLIIDEIELGLHTEAQKRLMKKLKEVCLERKAQIICTTHSSTIFECLPPEGRLFIENIKDKTSIIPEISSQYAFAKLGATNSGEIDILVEDKVAKNLLQSVLPVNLRGRVNIDVIGSASSLSRQAASIYQREDRKKFLIVFDGDQKSKEIDNFKIFKKSSESSDDNLKDWFLQNICYLPGDTWPENWILEKSKLNIDELATLFQSDTGLLEDIIKYGFEAGKHNEMHEIGTYLGLDDQTVLDRLCINIASNHSLDFQDFFDKIEQILSQISK